MPYRDDARATWAVRAIVRGPLGPVTMTGHVCALAEGEAVAAFVASLSAEGFEVIEPTPPQPVPEPWP